MMTVILEEVKEVLGADLGEDFDVELLILINANVTTLSELGVSELDDLNVVAGEEWPEFSNSKLLNLCKSYIAYKTKSIFDPVENKTLTDVQKQWVSEMEFRIVNISEYQLEVS